ncbi:MAG: hypothetical protein AAB706_03835 [Patescibacteria group bacterium]
MINIQKYLPQLLFGILLLILVYFVFSLPAKLNSSKNNEFSDRGTLDVPSEENVQNMEEKLSASTPVYGFSISEYNKAYPAYIFGSINPIYDQIAGEPVVVSRDSKGKVIMTHAETGEVFIPVEVAFQTWLASHPNTLIFSYND